MHCIHLNIFGLLLAVILPIANPAFAGDNVKNMDTDAAIFPIVSLETSLSSALAAYRQGLRYSRNAAAKKGDKTELQKVNAALAGLPVTDFSSVYSLDLRKSLNRKLENAASLFIKNASSAVAVLRKDPRRGADVKKLENHVNAVSMALAVVYHPLPLEFTLARCCPGGLSAFALADSADSHPASALRNEGQSPAAADTASFPERNTPKNENSAVSPQAAANNLPRPVRKYYRLTVDAAKDWQKYPLTVTMNDQVAIAAHGLWTPDNGSISPANADKHPYSLKIGSGHAVRAGVKHRFTAANDGELLLRIASRDAVAENHLAAAGILTLTVMIEKAGAGNNE